MLRFIAVIFTIIAFLGVNVFIEDAMAGSSLTLKKVLSKEVTVYDSPESFEGIDISRKKIPAPQSVLEVSKVNSRFLVSTSEGNKWIDSFEVQILEEESKKLATIERNRSKVSGGRGIVD